jgi:hypothetical protein
MNARMHAAVVIARRQAQETFLSPGLYITLALGLLLGWFLVNGFASSIDSSGFNPSMSPLYDLAARSFSAAFGASFVERLFAEGPFVLALFVSFLPVFLFLCIGSVFRFGQEKTAGAVELLTYGPADGTAYFAASYIKDVFFSALALLLIALFLAVMSVVDNLALGPLFFTALPILFFLTLAVLAYGVLCSIISANASSALAVFLGILLVFLLVLTGALSIASDSVRTVSSVAAAIVQWVSPFFYASLCMRAAQEGSAGAVAGGIGLTIALAAALLGVSHLAIRHRGVRA